MPSAQLVKRLHQDGRVVPRILMICLAMAGHAPEEIAGVVLYHPRTARRWPERCTQEGLPGRPDRPRLGSLQLRHRLIRCLAQPRQWITSRIRRNLRLYLSVRTVRRRLREVATWRRPRLIAKGDPKGKQRWAKVRQAIAAFWAGAVVRAEDGCHIDLLLGCAPPGSPRGNGCCFSTPTRASAAICSVLSTPAAADGSGP